MTNSRINRKHRRPTRILYSSYTKVAHFEMRNLKERKKYESSNYLHPFWFLEDTLFYCLLQGRNSLKN